MILDYRLHVFRTVARLLNFNQAARRLHITQPAVSKQIRELERICAVNLFDRQRRSVRLTDAGELVLRQANRILEEYEVMEVELRALQQKTAGELRVGASTTISHHIIPAYLAGFKQAYPLVSLCLLDANSQAIENWLADYTIDLGLIEGNKRSPDLHYLPFQQDELVLMSRPGNPNLPVKPFRLRDLAAFPLVVREKGSGTADVINSYLVTQGFDLSRLQIQMELGSTEAIKQYLLHSDTFAILSRDTIKLELAAGQLIIIGASELRIPRNYSFVHRAGEPTPLSQQFMQYCQPVTRLSSIPREPSNIYHLKAS